MAHSPTRPEDFEHESLNTLLARYARAIVEYHINDQSRPLPDCFIAPPDPSRTPRPSVVTDEEYAATFAARFDAQEAPATEPRPDQAADRSVMTPIIDAIAKMIVFKREKRNQWNDPIPTAMPWDDRQEEYTFIPKIGEPLRQTLIACSKYSTAPDRHSPWPIDQSFAMADRLGLLAEPKTPPQTDHPEQTATSDAISLAHALEIRTPEDLTIKISLSELKQNPITVCGPTGKTRSLSWTDNFKYARGTNKRKDILKTLAYNGGWFGYREGENRNQVSRYVNKLNSDLRRVLGIPNHDMRFVKCEYNQGVSAVCKIEQAPD